MSNYSIFIKILFFLYFLAITTNHLSAQQLLIEHQLFAPGAYIPSPKTEIADMDKDGDLDLFTQDVPSSSALIYRNQQGRMDTMPLVIKSDFYRLSYRVIDWNADSLPDLLLEGINAYQIYIRFNLGGLNFGPPQLLFTGYNQIERFIIKDLNNDGFVDLYTDNNTTPNCFLENKRGLPAATEIVRSWSSSAHIGFGDMDGDGRVEQINTNIMRDYTQILILQETGNYNYALTKTINIVGFSSYPFHVVDLDRDGRSEIIYLSGETSLRIIRETTPGQYSDTAIGNSDYVGLYT